MNKKGFSLFVCLIFLLTSYSVAALNESNKIRNYGEIETSRYIILYADNPTYITSILESEGFDVLRKTITEKSLELIVTPNELENLQNRGFNYDILSYGRPFVEIQEERQENFQGSSVPPGYLDYSDIFETMINYVIEYPSICKVVDLTETYDVPYTYNEQSIFAMKISDNVEENEDEPNFLMVSCHHAREIVTPVIAMYAIEQLTSEYGSDPDITAAVNDYEIWISPVWNPDGYEYCYYVDNWWRKNRNPPDGVDLNRNYPFGWNSGCSGSTDPYSETYKGSGPASEAETQTMIAFTNDRHFVKIIDYHSHGREVLHGYCCHSHPFSSFYQSEAVCLSNAAGYGGSIRTPSAEGEHYEWQIFTNGSFAFLMETHVEFQPSYASAEAEAAMVWPGTIWLLQRPISVSGHIVDSITGEPIVTQIIIKDVNFPNDEVFINEPKFGRYHLFLPPGIYTLEVSYENYHTQTHTVTVTSDSAEILDFELIRLNDPPNKPIINGETLGKEDEEYEYSFSASDPEEDNLEYYIKWGDGDELGWDGPYASGEEIIHSHIWEDDGMYLIEAKVRDVYGDESDWENLEVVIEPKSRIIFKNLLFEYIMVILHRLVYYLK